MNKIIFFLLLFLPNILFAATTTTPNSVVTAQLPELEAVSFTSNPMGFKNVYTAGSNGSKIVSLFVSNTDVTGHGVICSIGYPNSTPFGYDVVDVTVPANSGFLNSTPAVNLMSTTNWPGLPIDSDGNPFLYLSGNQTSGNSILECTYNVALTANDVINVVAIGADF